MNKHLVIGGFLVLAALAGGCIPEKRVAWSPDGQRAAVIGGDGLYFCDPQGVLTARVAEHVTAVRWLPRGDALLLVTATPGATWATASEILSDDQRAAVLERAPRLRAEILAHEGEWDGFEPASLQGLSGGEAGAVFTYMVEFEAEELAEKLGDKWDDLRQLRPTIYALELLPGAAQDDSAQSVTLRRALDAIEWPRIAPTGDALLFLAPSTRDSELRNLWAMAMQPGATPVLIAENVAMFPDWTPDGRAVVYASTAALLNEGDDTLRLGTISERVLRGSDGQFLAEPEDPQELAGIVFQKEVRVRCLKDGRILFVSVELQIPCTSPDMPQRAGLFSINPAQQPVVARVIPRQAELALPDALYLFELSPDEQYVAVPGGNGRLAVLQLATGDVWELVHEGEGDNLRTQPAWRSPDELTYVAGKDDEGRAGLMLAKLNFGTRSLDARVLSADWPTEVVSGFLQDEQRQSEPSAEESDAAE